MGMGAHTATATFNGVVSGITNISIEQVKGAYGQKGNTVSMTVELNSTALTYAEGQTGDLVIRPSAQAEWDMDFPKARIMDVSIPISGGEFVTQKLTFECRTTMAQRVRGFLAFASSFTSGIASGWTFTRTTTATFQISRA